MVVVCESRVSRNLTQRREGAGNVVSYDIVLAGDMLRIDADRGANLHRRKNSEEGAAHNGASSGGPLQAAQRGHAVRLEQGNRMSAGREVRDLLGGDDGSGVHEDDDRELQVVDRYKIWADDHALHVCDNVPGLDGVGPWEEEEEAKVVAVPSPCKQGSVAPATPVGGAGDHPCHRRLPAGKVVVATEETTEKLDVGECCRRR